MSNRRYVQKIKSRHILLNDGYVPGAGAVASFLKTLGLNPIDTTVHTSLSDAFGATEVPVATFFDSAKRALEDLKTSTK